MKRYRVVKIPIPGEKSKYEVQVHELEIRTVWFSEKRTWKWHELDEYGWALYSGLPIPPPPLDLFDTIEDAKDYIKMGLEYLAKTPEVVFDTLTANPPTDIGT